MEKLYKNEYLFSEIYLKEITKIKEDSSIVATLSTLKEYREYAHFETLEEWNRSFVHEVLKALKFGIKIVDENVSYVYQIGKPDENISICYSLLPSEDLENTSMGKNWAEKIIRNLKKNAFKWGILTNGDKWRIYYTEEVTPYENYLEIDLKGTLDSDNVLQFQIFYKFMKAENFTVDKQGSCLFDVFKKESQDRIDYIEEELKNALKQKEEGGKGILSNLCLGYTIDLRKSGHLDFSDDNLRNIYGSAMLYMFRLLFLFYSEARGLLKDKALEAFLFVLETAKNNQEKSELNKDSYELWMNLSNIFANIDLTYNGGLFNPSENKYTTFLEDNKISDIYLTPVLYYMTYYEDKSGNYSPISYRDMGVRHLGTLYEGLLEHKLFVAEEDVEVQVSKKEVKFIPTSAGGKIIKGKYISKGYIYFGTDKDERKASGSYYTPEDVVDYIVTNTVGKKLNELKDEFIKNNKRILELFKTSISDSERRSISALIGDKLEEFMRERILKLSVLDPAMGSGHFLVGVSNRISNFITETMNEFNLISEKDTSVNLWKRRVVENCIYGVDMNLLAVELARLSLWILSMAKDKPLSFLNHHLKCGNSLVGASLVDVGNYPEKNKRNIATVQIDLFKNNNKFKSTVKKIISNYQQIELNDSRNLDDIGEKKQWLDEINSAFKPYKVICDFHISAALRDDISQNDYNKVLSNFNKGNTEFTWEENSFFHWELEFPEILLGNDGFDVVVGNPPYVKYSNIEKQYQVVEYVTRSCSNLFTLMIERSLDLSKHGAIFGMIIPIWGNSNPEYQILREVIIENSKEIKLSHFAVRPSKIFDNAEMNLTIMILSKRLGNQEAVVFRTTNYIRWHRNERKNLFNMIKYIEIDVDGIISHLEHKLFPKVSSPLEVSILKKISIVPSRIDKYLASVQDEKIDVFVHSGGRYWRKAFDEHYVKEINLKINSNWKKISLKKKYAYPIACLFNSSFFYWFWIAFSDCYNVRRELLDLVPMNFDLDLLGNFEDLYWKLVSDYKRNIIVNEGYKYDNKYIFNISKSKSIIDQIDVELGKHYGLNEDEINFIINYDIRFRCGGE